MKVFHEDTSHSQNENLNTIVDFHNAQTRDLDVSVHFNAYEQVEKPMGTEVLYVTQSALAGQVSAAIASCGFINRVERSAPTCSSSTTLRCQRS